MEAIMKLLHCKKTSMGLILAGFLLFTCPAGIPPPHALAGSCIGGERARVRYLFERLEHLTTVGIQKVLSQATHLSKRIAKYLPFFSLWWLNLQTRHSLLQLLQSAAQDPGKLADVHRLREALEPYWKQAARIQKHFFSMEVEVQPALDDTIAFVAKNWAACRSIKTVGPEPCGLLESIDPKLKSECIGLMTRFGVLYAGRCSSEKNTELIAKITGEPPGKIGEICQILKDRQGDRCPVVISSTQGIQMCLALTGQGEAACRHSSLSERDSTNCLRDLYAYQAASGARSLESWEQTGPKPMLVAVIHSIRGPGDCVDINMRLYDRHDKSSEEFFLQRNRWYQPPGIP
jgi:hypothetical protein